jgi:hypothetical protein
MEQIQQINVYKYVHMVNLHKILPECVSQLAPMEHLLIVMLKYVLLFVVQHRIYMVIQQ